MFIRSCPYDWERIVKKNQPDLSQKIMFKLTEELNLIQLIKIVIGIGAFVIALLILKDLNEIKDMLKSNEKVEKAIQKGTTQFIEPTIPQEAFKESNNITDFINKL